MIRILLALLVNFQALLLEIGGAAAIVYGVSLYSTAGAWIAIGVALLLKSVDLDLAQPDEDS